MSKKRRTVPVFENEAKERVFWENHDSADYVDWNQAERVPFSESQALQQGHFAEVAGGSARADQDCR